ncbi:hypothetical protein HY477_03385 [Candidatus Uhrbacteria bacterium]|nr:hypothetical protein [Candidatus Uhrbacteria bacterium]
MRVHVLHEPTYTRNVEVLLFPLIFNRKRLRERGIELAFFKRIVPLLFECDVLCVSSKFFSRWWIERGADSVPQFLQQARRKGAERVLWFDMGDGTGASQFEVLPYIDRYVKGQLLRPLTNYQKNYYGMRIFTDLIHEKFGIEDGHPDELHLRKVPTDEELKKLTVGWSWGMMNYGRFGEVWGKISFRSSLLPRFVPRHWYEPSADRPVLISCRIGTRYTRPTVAFPRLEIKRRLEGKVPSDFISRREFFKELTQSLGAITPFGYGEVCYRDYEIVLAGATMIKQDMSHLETWPHIWRGEETYVPFKWDLSDFDEKLEYARNHRGEMADRARAAQVIYKRALVSEEGHQEFCDRFMRIISA